MKRSLSFTPALPHHAPILHQLYQDTPGYFALLGGEVPTLGEVQRDLLTVAEDPHRQLELIHEPGGELVGSVDYKTEYPDPGDLTINLLLIREACQSQGWGAEAARQLEERHARRNRRILASVLGDNVRGARFWQGLGYRFALDARPAMTWYAKDLGPSSATRRPLLSSPAR